MAKRERRNRRWGPLLVSTAVVGLAAFLFSAGSRSPHAQAANATAGQTMAPSPEAIEDGFEPRDINPRAIGIAMVIAVTAIAVAITGLIVMLHVMDARDKAGPPLTAEQTAPITPPGPPLQGFPLDDIATLRQRETAALTAYRWLGQDHAFAQIPISRAMQLVTGASLDPKPPAAAPQSGTAP